MGRPATVARSSHLHVREAEVLKFEQSEGQVSGTESRRCQGGEPARVNESYVDQVHTERTDETILRRLRVNAFLGQSYAPRLPIQSKVRRLNVEKTVDRFEI